MSVSKSKVDKPTPNYMIFEGDFSYSKKLILTYDDAITFLQALKNAEVLTGSYGTDKGIREVEENDIKTTIMGAQEYGEIKLKSILVPEE